MSIADRFFFERFNENHDPSNGQFAEGGGSGGGSSGNVSTKAANAGNASKPKPEAAHTATSYEFVSPSVASHLDFHEAVSAISSGQQQSLREASVYINGALDIDAHEYDIVGAWADGAENSVLDVVDKADWEKLKLSAAMKGYVADQKQVLVFQEAEGGEAAMAHFEAPGELADIHKSLLQDGVSFHTLVPHDGGATVYVADLDGSAADAIEKAASRYDAEVGIKWGRAEFLGTQKQDGSDREQRDDARRLYEENISKSKVDGHDEVWARVRDRWGQGIHQSGQAGLTQHSASDLFDQYHDASANADDIIKSVEGASAAVSAAETKLKDGTQTNAPVSKGGFIQADGTYTPERQELHDRILNNLFSSAAVKAATPAAGEKPVMTLLGGRGGSGKAWFTRSGVADATRAVYINSDDIQAELPGYEGWNAALYHDEASDITKRADDIARALGVSVIHDATMRTPGGSAKRAGEYKAAGYAVHGHYMFLPPQTSTKRAVERFVRGGATGRYVPPSYLLNSTTNERSFDSLKGQLDKWSIYDNTGASPKLVAEGGTGEKEKRDARYSARQIRARSRSAGGRRQPLFEGKPRQAEADDRTAEEGTAAEVARAPYRARAMSWFFERYNENHDPSNGQFAEGGGGGGSSSSSGSSASSGSSKGAGKTGSKSSGGSKSASKTAPAATEKAVAETGDKSDKRRAKLEDFQKANIQLDHTTAAHKANVDKFIDTWSERIGEEPEAFKKAFTGGVNVNMNIVASDPSKWSISGEVLDDKGARIGTYTREINWRTKTAESAYFALGRNATGQTATGHNIGKQMLAGNVETYQKLGLDAVRVHANIDVGGYAWAKYGYVPTAESWRGLSADIRSKLRGGSGGPRVGAGGFDGDTYTPDSWEELSDDEQETVKYQWMRDTKSDFIDNEISNWRDNGGALDDAKYQLAYNHDSDAEWAHDTIKDYLDEHAENGKPVPFTADQIAEALSVDYENDGEGRNDPDISFDDKKLQEPAGIDPDQMELPGIDKSEPHERLTADMRDELTERLTKAFNDKADSDQGDIEPPDHLEQVDEYQEQHWDGMSERERYRWARDNGVLPQHEIENDDPDDIDPDDVEKDEGSDDTLMRLASSSNPKALWAIADSARGKELLLGSDWYGVLRLNDKDTMDRFNAYVGKKKAA